MAQERAMVWVLGWSGNATHDEYVHWLPAEPLPLRRWLARSCGGATQWGCRILTGYWPRCPDCLRLSGEQEPPFTNEKNPRGKAKACKGKAAESDEPEPEPESAVVIPIQRARGK